MVQGGCMCVCFRVCERRFFILVLAGAGGREEFFKMTIFACGRA